MASDHNRGDAPLFIDSGRQLNMGQIAWLRRQFPVGWSRRHIFFLLIACALILFVQWNNYLPQYKTRFLVRPRVDRGTCCHSSSTLHDICGRNNCTLPCTPPESSALDNNPRECATHPEKRAFFIETSASGSLNIRQACAVESLALHNPNLTVNVLFVDVPINTSTVALQKLKEKYKNIQLVSIDLEDYLAGTVLEHWYYCTDWKKGSFYVNNLSNGLRLLTLTKYGGYYFDLDIISVRPVTYYRNFVTAEDSAGLNSDVIHADLKNPFIAMVIEYFVADFQSEIWGHNGPKLISRVLKNWCNVTNIQSMDYVTCRGFNVLPSTSFHPVYYDQVKSLFTQRLANETNVHPTWLTDKVIGVHIWNKLSKDEPIYKNSTQDYTRLARTNCPVVFSIAPDVF